MPNEPDWRACGAASGNGGTAPGAGRLAWVEAAPVESVPSSRPLGVDRAKTAESRHFPQAEVGPSESHLRERAGWEWGSRGRGSAASRCTPRTIVSASRIAETSRRDSGRRHGERRRRESHRRERALRDHPGPHAVRPSGVAGAADRVRAGESRGGVRARRHRSPRYDRRAVRARRRPGDRRSRPASAPARFDGRLRLVPFVFRRHNAR
jgi:hypothetical protein